MTVIELAKVCREANRAFCETLGDSRQPAWEKAPDWPVKAKCGTDE